jgi:hypothetical protein
MQGLHEYPVSMVWVVRGAESLRPDFEVVRMRCYKWGCLHELPSKVFDQTRLTGGVDNYQMKRKWSMIIFQYVIERLASE